jgi:ankyrin repeat protein
LAVGNAHYELAEFLLDSGAKEDAAALGWTVLHEITWVRKPGAGANPLPPDGSGKVSSLDFVRAMVRHGADVNARVTKKPYDLGTTNLKVIGATPLLMAARTADAPLMQLLAQLGADPLLANVDHTTPLMAAAGVGTQQFGEDPGTEEEVLEAVKVALDLGGDINGVDDNGETVIHGAAYKEVPSVVQFLLEKGAKLEIWNRKNKLGWTPLRISEGVTRGQNIRHRSPATAAVIRHALSEAGLSTVVEPEKKRE